MEKQKIKVNRTSEGTLFEIVFVVLAVIVWALIIWMLSEAPNVIVTHFDGNGNPNGYGSPWGLLVPCFITTIAGGALLVAAYHPHLINMPVKINNLRQYELAIRSTRIAALILLLLALAIPVTLLTFRNPTPWPILGCISLLFINIIVFCVLIHRAK